MIFCDADNIAGPAGPITPEAIRREAQRQVEAVRAVRLRLQQAVPFRAVAAVRIDG